MPQFSNIHALLDNEELHPPRDFSLANNNTKLGKDPMGQLVWMEEYWQRPVKGLVDYTELPSTPTHGDRYVIVTTGSTAIDSTAIDTTAIDSTALGSTAIDVSILPDDLQWNDIVQYFSTDNDGNTVDQWVGVSPKKGYRLHDTASNALYHYTGSHWMKDKQQGSGQVAMAQEYKTRQQLLDLKALDKLEPGVRYYITDKDIILTAVSGSELSIDGDHTRSLSAFSYFDFYDLWTSGSITSVTANGVEILDNVVSFDTDIYESVIQLSDAINDHLDFVGYWILDAGTRAIFINAPEEGRSILDVTVTINGSTFDGDQFFYGHDVGELWFKVRYDIENDHLYEMSDQRGNVVRYDPEKPIIGDIDPYFVFPWGHANVTNNTVNNGALIAYSATGVISNNIVDYGLFRADGYSGQGIEHNKVLYGSQLQAMMAEGLVIMNTVELWSALFLNGTKGHAGVNHIYNGFINATGSYLKGVGINTVRDTQLNLENYGDNSEVVYNTFASCNMIDLVNSKGHIKHCQFKDSDVLGANGMLDLIHTHVVESELNYNGSLPGSELRHARIERQSTIDMSNAKLRIHKSDIESSTINAQGADVMIEVCTIKAYSVLDMTNATISSFSYNDLNNTDWTLADANTIIERNHVDFSTIDCTSYKGTEFRENRVVSSSVELVGSHSAVYGNDIYKGELYCNNASGGIIHNKLSYSAIVANNFVGVKLIHSEVFGLSELNISSATSEFGALRILDKTVLDASGTISPIYDLELKLTESTIVLMDTIISKTIKRSYSDREFYYDVNISGGLLDFNKDEALFSGVVNCISSGVINTITNAQYAPEVIKIKVLSPNFVTIDSTTATNIVLPNGIVSVSLDGSKGDFLELTYNSELASFLVTSIHTF